MDDSFTAIEETLKEVCRRGPVYYFPNRGNWGDALIRHGTLKFLRDINVDYKEVTPRRRDWLLPIMNGGTVIYGGGGAWCKLWKQSPRYVKRIRRRFNVVVLPSTYEQTYSIPDTIFFCRDICESRQNMPVATFCHDMAYYIGNEFVAKGIGTGKGYFFRTDKESSKQIRIPRNNNDISPTGDHLSNVIPFFEEVNRFEVIYTDRLHVSIAGCLLNKEVHLYSGSYFKNRAVYMSSMKTYFDNVHFHESFAL